MKEVILIEDEILGRDIPDIKEDHFHVPIDELTTLLNKIDIRVQPSEVEDNTYLGTELEDLFFDEFGISMSI
ncbi:hypothetical protein DPV78_007545 [Talaromyces pinophilus]|nr:hypothetical protein DPV78_007545 [Talaromyces pinophilus]